MHCPQCGSKVSMPNLAHQQRAVCPQCHHTLSVYHRRDIPLCLSLAFSSLIFLLLALPFNFLSFKASGQQNLIGLPSALTVLIEQNYASLALITGLATLVLPGLVLTGVIILLSAYLFSTPKPWLKTVERWITRLIPWSMAEIFLLGTLVSLIKISDIADIGLGTSFYAFGLFSLTMSATLFYYDQTRITIWLNKGCPPLREPLNKNAASLSVQRTWALLLCGVLLYIPANTLPIMQTQLFGVEDPNTIMGGVMVLWDSGSYPIAAIIFFASVLIPIVKLVMLSWLTYTAQNNLSQNPMRLVRYYRFIEFIGRWSMVDIFVVAILVALIQLGSAMSVHPGPAALAFCGLVFITMVAAMTFDTRLLWLDRKIKEL